MGIFDEAIREHLDLKRRQGVDENELKELEDEAFGLPVRPGDELEAEREAPAEGGEAEPVEAQPAQAEEVAAPAAEVAPATGEEPAEPESEEMPEAVPDPVDETPPHGDAVLEDSAATPPPPTDEGPVEDEGAAEFSTAEREAIADKPTEFFDQAPEPLELGELDLDLDEELDEVGAIEEPVTGEEPAEEAPEPEAAAEPQVEEPAPEGEEPDGEEPADGGDKAEDVLEETPEFLRENPDDDELWFEQGKPKDFDF